MKGRDNDLTKNEGTKKVMMIIEIIKGKKMRMESVGEECRWK